jgi:hypothetical protein
MVLELFTLKSPQYAKFRPQSVALISHCAKEKPMQVFALPFNNAEFIVAESSIEI